MSNYTESRLLELFCFLMIWSLSNFGGLCNTVQCQSVLRIEFEIYKHTIIKKKANVRALNYTIKLLLCIVQLTSFCFCFLKPITKCHLLILTGWRILSWNQCGHWCRPTCLSGAHIKWQLWFSTDTNLYKSRSMSKCTPHKTAKGLTNIQMFQEWCSQEQGKTVKCNHRK